MISYIRVHQSGPLRAHGRYSGAMSCIMVRGGNMKSKGAIGRPWDHNFLKLTLDILKWQIKRKKIVEVFLITA